MKFIISGDLVPTESNFHLFSNANAEALVDEGIRKIFSGADHRIFNLECPLYDGESPIPKTGPTLAAPVSTANAISKLNPSLLSLANNHILDHGNEGLFSTMKTLQDKGIEFIGAGKNLTEAAKPHFFEKDGKRIGVYACAENEFSIAEKDNAGANPFDPFESLDHILELKKICDYVIVLHHGGKEHFRYPSPALQKTCRKMAKKGADLIICQHSHCIGCFEEYEGSVILYGQGNFLFDLLENEFWQTGLLVSVKFYEKMAVEYIPICKHKNSVRMANDLEAKKIISEFQMRSNQILEEGFVRKNYTEFADGLLDGYLSRFLNADCPAEADISDIYYMGTLNRVRCEAHNEILVEGIKYRLKGRFKGEH